VIHLTLALLYATPAHACGHDFHDDCDAVEIEVAVFDADEDDAEPPQASVGSRDHDRDEIQLAYGMQFLPDAPAHHLFARMVGDKDAYLGGELRYMPGTDLMWSGRAGAGLDVLGGGNWDLTLGLFIGSAGIWDRDSDRAVLYSTPIGGTEIAFGIEAERLYGRYRWLAGWGMGEVSEMLTENELTVGFKVTPEVHAYGQFLHLSPGEADKESAVGLGARVVF
jgi:hypothetical protein